VPRSGIRKGTSRCPNCRSGIGIGAHAVDVLFLDLPTEEEPAIIWHIYLKKYGVSGELPVDEGWTGAEIKECCRKAHRLRKSLVHASRYIVPVSRSAAEQVKALRQMASGKFISASTQSMYQCLNIKSS
jgi:hypothetical protein